MQLSLCSFDLIESGLGVSYWAQFPVPGSVESWSVTAWVPQIVYRRFGLLSAPMCITVKADTAYKQIRDCALHFR
jgi:hypothetical protein